VLDACARWDFERGTAAPTSNVFKYIRGFMHRYAVAAESCVRVPVHAYDRRSRASARMMEFGKTLSLAPVCRMLSEYEGTPSNELYPLKGRDVAGEDVLEEDEPIEGRFFDADAESAEEVLAEFDVARGAPRVVEALLALCDDRELDIVARRFADDSWTLEEVGRSYGFTRERARQIENKALRLCLDRSRRILARADWDGYDGWLAVLVERVRAADRERRDPVPGARRSTPGEPGTTEAA
jgi:RNA polymerase primary sigma factor